MSATAATLLRCDGCARRTFVDVGPAAFVRSRALANGWQCRGGVDWCPDCAAQPDVEPDGEAVA